MAENNIATDVATLKAEVKWLKKEVERLRAEMKTEMAGSSYQRGGQAMMTKIALVSAAVASAVAVLLTRLLPMWGL